MYNVLKLVSRNLFRKKSIFNITSDYLIEWRKHELSERQRLVLLNKLGCVTEGRASNMVKFHKIIR